MPSIGELCMYDKACLRTCKCWRCAYKGEYDWQKTKRMYCTKTKRWGSVIRAYWCKHFLDNSRS